MGLNGYEFWHPNSPPQSTHLRTSTTVATGTAHSTTVSASATSGSAGRIRSICLWKASLRTTPSSVGINTRFTVDLARSCNVGGRYSKALCQRLVRGWLQPKGEVIASIPTVNRLVAPFSSPTMSHLANDSCLAAAKAFPAPLSGRGRCSYHSAVHQQALHQG